MTQPPFETEPSSEQEPTLQEIAFRKGSPEEWGSAEYNFDVMSRICNVLGLTHFTNEIREVGIAEADRQAELFKHWVWQQRMDREYEEYRQRMGSVATNLVNVLVPADDPRNREDLIDGVLAALRPIDERLTRAEWDGVVGRH